MSAHSSIRIVSGGQTGVDRAALDFALRHGLDCGGWCPAGREAEDGPIPARYRLVEIDGGYPERTRANVRDSDATVIFHHGPVAGGTRLTAELCRRLDRPLLALDLAHLAPEEAAAKLRAFVADYGVAALNVAGPRASEWPEAHARTTAVLKAWQGS